MEKLVLENLINKNLSQREIAYKLNVSQSSVRHWLKKYNLSTNNARNNKKIKYCKNCNNLLKERHLTYCSKKCFHKYHYKNNIKKWFSNNKIKEQVPNYIKKYLKELHGNKCSICNITEWRNKPAPLVLDHIDGNPYNNTIENLRLVCGNCDMQLPTYKSKNKNGRFSRRKRYEEGKSY